MRYADLLQARIARRYQLVARLGEGDSGVCFLAHDRDGREVVVKVIDRLRVSDEAISRYIQTASTLKALGDPRVVSTLDVAHDLGRGLLVIAREPMRGIDLAGVVACVAPMDPRGAIVLAAMVSEAVAAAHAAGVVHAAIKPSNVFLEPGPSGEVVVRICDPAVSAKLRPAGEAPTLAAEEIAPELSAPTAQPDARSDVYSVGVMLFTLLTGERARARLAEFAPWIEPRVARVVDGATRADPSTRTSSARALAEALREIAGEDGVLRPAMLVPVSEETRAKRDAHVEEAAPLVSSGARDPLVGHLLGGHYTIARALGHGGMGAVYEVTSPDGETLAAKIVASADGAQTQLFARFLREARAATSILHRNVVRTVELGTDMTVGAPFMVMELLRGRDLARVLREHRALDPIVAARIFAQAARGLAAAHRAGVVHRDVKPANLFLSTDTSGEVTVKICDFGLAKAIAAEIDGVASELTRAGSIIGTPAYMSPEHAAGARDVDARSDLFSLCASLYEALSGTRLWAGHDAAGAELLHVICTQPVRPLDRIAPHLPRELVAIVSRGLERDRKARWRDADALADALDAYAGSDRVTIDDLRPAAPPEAPSTPRQATTNLTPLPLDQSTQAFEQSVPRRADAIHERPDPSAPPVRPARRSTLRAAIALGGLAAVGAAAFAATRPALHVRAPASVSPPPIAMKCASNADCTRALGRLAICDPERACVALESDECVARTPAGAAPDDATLWIGVMFPRSGDAFATLWGPAAQTVDLAARDFNDLLGGIPDPRPGHGPRPIGIVACDDSDDARAARAAHHLVEAVRVPAVIGFRSSKELIALAGSEFLPHGVLAVATFNKSALVSSIPHPEDSPRLVWRLAPSNAQDAAPLSALIAEIIEPELRAGALGPRAPMRVTVVRPDGATGVGFEDGLLARLRYNGKSIVENRESFQDLVVDEASADPLAGIVDKLLDFEPHVIAYAADSILARLPEAVERRWRGAMRPRYVFGAPLQDVALQRLVQSTPELARRIVGISTPAATLPNMKLAAHYDQVFGADLTATTTTPNPYDAVYLLAYAAIASGDARITGTSLARAIDRLLPPGDAVEVGPARILDAYNALRAGKRIDLFGASGPLDFDTSTGEALFDYVFECVAVSRGRARRAETDLRFDLRTRKLSGSLTCR